ncbi:MAG: hypothetical protein IPH69_17845 [Bacteroidales bacterium]|nr:hypothetical protein [Bacteroidales bacterium]
METKKIYLILLFLALSIYSFSGFQITPLKLEFGGKQLQITCDFVNKSGR